LAEPVARREILPQMALQMIRVGEESGSLDAMLTKVAEIYDKETQASVKRMLTLLEPVLIIGLGVVVAGIIISIIVPILGANELVM
jgi:general secretion pathway protein F